MHFIPGPHFTAPFWSDLGFLERGPRMKLHIAEKRMIQKETWANALIHFINFFFPK